MILAPWSFRALANARRFGKMIWRVFRQEARQTASNTDSDNLLSHRPNKEQLRSSSSRCPRALRAWRLHI